jgi:hypothetical protein
MQRKVVSKKNPTQPFPTLTHLSLSRRPFRTDGHGTHCAGTVLLIKSTIYVC